MTGLFGENIARAGRVAVVAAALAFGLAAAPAQETPPSTPAAAAAQQPADPAAGIDALKASLLEIEGDYRNTLHSEHAEDELDALIDRLAPLRGELRDRLGKLEPRLKGIDQRATELAQPPGAGAAEDPAIAAERQRLTTRRSELEAALQQVKLLADRGNNLDEHIRERRRDIFSSQLFARSATLFDSAFWGDLLPSIPAEINGLTVMVSSWSAYARDNGGLGGAVAALAVLAALGVAAWFMSQWRRRLTAGPMPRSFDKALAAVVRMASATVKIPALVAATVLVLRNFSLMSDSLAEIGIGLAWATLAAGFGRGVGLGLFAPGEPDRRIVALTDQEAATYASHLIWAARFSGLCLLVLKVHHILGTSGAPIVATRGLFALSILAVTVHLLWRFARARAVQAEPAGTRRGWVRAILWLCTVALVIGLATGYLNFAVYVAARVLAAFAVGGAVFILFTIIDAALTDLLAPGTPGGRSIAVAFGLTSRGLDLVATLASALLRVVVAVLTVMLALRLAGIFTDDVYSALQRAISDYDIGAVHVSPVAILTALACLTIGGLAVRAAQRWLTINFLPRTGLEAGLQNSIVALSGYISLIVVLAVSLGILGIDLQKIALIAGALSVGIGFGLQSVVSNFVSGLILLAERSIRVGDWVVVKNEEGFVRRISIRATEIETFDRASVIIPNQEFITGAVKNWTHNNTVGRVIVKVRVAFDSDVMRVRELLLEAAVKHPQVLPGTPSAFVMGFGDIGIDFELMCLVANVSQGLTVRTDLYMDILGKFRDARIKIPYPMHETGVPALPPQVQPSPKIA
jgi:potassium-dependent mechanosensitive channel